MTRFAQQTKLLAKEGCAIALREKFIEAAQLQHGNAACEVMLSGISASEPNAVYVFEVWSSESEWEAVRGSDVITEWSKGMPELVAEWPISIKLDSVEGKGI